MKLFQIEKCKWENICRNSLFKVKSVTNLKSKQVFKSHPNTVENIAIGKNSDIQVWLDDVVEFAFFFISEECVRHPHLEQWVNSQDHVGLVGHLATICHGQVLDLPTPVVESKSVIVPLLPEGDLDTELHLDIINLLKAPDIQIHQHLCWTIIIFISTVLTEPLRSNVAVINCRCKKLVQNLLLYLPVVFGWWWEVGGNNINHKTECEKCQGVTECAGPDHCDCSFGWMVVSIWNN